MQLFRCSEFWHGKSKCKLEIARHEDRAVVTLIELSDNPGKSITNMYERFATSIYQHFLRDLDPTNIMWLEHYPKGILDETWRRVIMKWDSKSFKQPDEVKVNER